MTSKRHKSLKMYLKKVKRTFLSAYNTVTIVEIITHSGLLGPR